MWYVSGNRDEDVIEDADRFLIDRRNPHNHLSFGFGIHRCVGLRVAELQLRIIWEEILKRFDRIEVVGEPKHVYSSFVKRLRGPAGAHCGVRKLCGFSNPRDRFQKRLLDRILPSSIALNDRRLEGLRA